MSIRSVEEVQLVGVQGGLDEDLATSSVAATAVVEKSRRRRTYRRKPTILAIGMPASCKVGDATITHAASPRDVIELLRMLQFNLLLVNAEAKDRAVWNLLAVVRRHWTNLRWVLYREDCTDEEEVLARSLGAVSITADQALIAELAKRR